MTAEKKEYRFKIVSEGELEFVVADTPPVPKAERRGSSFRSMLMDRSPKAIAQSHQMSLEQLSDLISTRRRILDIGTGKSTLWKAVDKVGKLHSLDVLLPEQVDYPTDEQNWVQASGDVLPFRDESFDLILATRSLPSWAHSPEQARRFFNDVYRCVQMGGIVCANVVPVDVCAINFEIYPDNLEGNDVSFDFTGAQTLKYKKLGSFTVVEKQMLNIPE